MTALGNFMLYVRNILYVRLEQFESIYKIISVYLKSLHDEFRRTFALKPLPCQFEMNCEEGTVFYQNRLMTMHADNYIVIEGSNVNRKHSDVKGRV